jgi:hypothetical protein
MMKESEFFLLDPDNKEFAEGSSSRLPGGGHGCLLLVLGLFTVAGLLLAAATARQWARFVMLSASYAHAQGHVLGREIVSDDGVEYYVTYRFVVDDRVHTIEESVAEETYQSAEEGQSLAVRYALRDPNVATIQPGRLGMLPALTGFCLIWNGTVLLLARASVLELLKRRRLAQHGQRVLGELTHAAGQPNSDGDFELQIGFGFRSPQTGEWSRGEDSRVRKDLKDTPLPPPGTPIRVVYLDDDTHMVL